MKNLPPVLVLVFGLPALLLSDPVKIFREDWAETPFALPITQEHVANEALSLNLYGGAVGYLKKSHHEEIANDPFYVWSGEIKETNVWGATLSFKDGRSFDLSGEASLTWRTRQSGEHCLHIILRTMGGDWLLSEATNCETADWQVTTHVFSSLSWKALDADHIDLGDAVRIADPDLSRIVEVGFTDLMAGASSAQSSRVDWLEVHGYERQTCDISMLSTSSLLYRSSAELVNDGNLGTHWMSEGSGLSLTAELEALSQIQGFEIAWWKNRERTTYFELEVSSDGSSWTPVLTGMQTDGLVRDFEYYPLPEAVEARFIKVIGRENSVNRWNSIAELRIMGASLSTGWFESYPHVDGWYNVDWLGFIYAERSPWILHTGLGWVYMTASENGSFFVWDYDLGWLFTSESVYPTFYAYNNTKWYMFSSGPDPRWFYNLTDGVWESL